MRLIFKGKRANTGEVRIRKDGAYKKLPDGSWKQVPMPKPKNVAKKKAKIKRARGIKEKEQIEEKAQTEKKEFRDSVRRDIEDRNFEAAAKKIADTEGFKRIAPYLSIGIAESSEQHIAGALKYAVEQARNPESAIAVMDSFIFNTVAGRISSDSYFMPLAIAIETYASQRIEYSNEDMGKAEYMHKMFRSKGHRSASFFLDAVKKGINFAKVHEALENSIGDDWEDEVDFDILADRLLYNVPDDLAYVGAPEKNPIMYQLRAIEEATKTGELVIGLKNHDRREYQDMPLEVRETAFYGGELDGTADLGGGVNDSIVGQFSDDTNGVVVEGVIKSKVGEFNDGSEWAVGREGIPSGTQYMREAAAYEISKAIGFDIVPPTVIRDIPDKGLCSIQEYQGGYDQGSSSGLNTREQTTETDRAAALDFILWNTDRHTGNFMVSESGSIRCIDNGLTLPANETVEFRSAFSRSYPSYIEPEIMEQLQNTDWEGVAERLLDIGIEPRAVDLMYRRAQFLMSEGELPAERMTPMDREHWRGYPSYSGVDYDKYGRPMSDYYPS